MCIRDRYIGEPGSRSTTHVDTNFSSAWLWLAEGEKAWRCVHGQDFELLCSGDAEVSTQDFIDLFDTEQLSTLPAEARVYAGEQRAGDIMFNPARCIHAVHNNTHTVSLTHNYVDATNLAWVLHDAVRSLSVDMMPALRGMDPEQAQEAVQGIALSLDLIPDMLVLKLKELAQFLSDEPAARARVVAEAAAGEDVVQHVLGEHLGARMPKVALELVELVRELLELVQEDSSSSESDSLEFEYDSSDSS
eukprot:TRINITY_DN9694_c0_g1_i1.p1 TRINITY_DN9694_c0_g1~~TRINITY_DN9694_c0_g1_i1.p1  ORF type:complete len:248 (-),score=91.85 TRINITY_DN9694_c0_g1_i1:19-762(-)